MKDYDVVIIGAGPSGITLGYLLTKNNINCCIVEKQKFPREKLCGGLLTKKTYDLITDVYGNIEYDYNITNDVELYYNTKLFMKYKSDDAFRNVERKDFDNKLLKEYLNIGGTIIFSGAVKYDVSDKIEITIENGNKIYSKYLVGADGALSSVRRLIDKEYEPKGFCTEGYSEKTDNIIKIFFGNRYNKGYGWVIPKKNNMAVGFGECKNKLDPIIKYNNFTEEKNLKCSKVRGAFIPYNKCDCKIAENKIFLVGDAAGFVDPLTGEGIYFAILSAKKLAEVFIENLNTKEEEYIKKTKNIVKIINKTVKYRNVFYSKLFQKVGFKMFKSSKFGRFVAKNMFSKYKLMFYGIFSKEI